jgi:hypothetical protein
MHIEVTRTGGQQGTTLFPKPQNVRLEIWNKPYEQGRGMLDAHTLFTVTLHEGQPPMIQSTSGLNGSIAAAAEYAQALLKAIQIAANPEPYLAQTSADGAPTDYNPTIDHPSVYAELLGLPYDEDAEGGMGVMARAILKRMMDVDAFNKPSVVPIPVMQSFLSEKLQGRKFADLTSDEQDARGREIAAFIEDYDESTNGE